MHPYLLSLLILLLAGHASAQPSIPFQFTSEEDNRLIKENDSLKYYVATGDTSYIVTMNEEASMYRLLTKDHRMLAEGTYITEGDKYLQDGKWIQRFDNGKTMLTGYYQKSKPAGTWEEFYDNGKLKAIYNYAIMKDDKGEVATCLSGSYREYYKNGKLKTVGFYAAIPERVSETIDVVDPVTSVTVKTVVKHTNYRAEKIGHWEHYEESGEAEKKEDKD